MPRPKLGELSGKAMLWHRDRLVDVEVKSSFEEDLGPVTTESADRLDVPRPILPKSGDLPRLAHEVRCTWTAIPPTLAIKSQERTRPTDEGTTPQPYTPPVFREPNGRIVVAVQSPDELDRARAIMDEIGAAAIVVAEGALR